MKTSLISPIYFILIQRESLIFDAIQSRLRITWRFLVVTLNTAFYIPSKFVSFYYRTTALYTTVMEEQAKIYFRKKVNKHIAASANEETVTHENVLTRPTFSSAHTTPFPVSRHTTVSQFSAIQGVCLSILNRSLLKPEICHVHLMISKTYFVVYSFTTNSLSRGSENAQNSVKHQWQYTQHCNFQFIGTSLKKCDANISCTKQSSNSLQIYLTSWEMLHSISWFKSFIYHNDCNAFTFVRSHSASCISLVSCVYTTYTYLYSGLTNLNFLQ